MSYEYARKSRRYIPASEREAAAKFAYFRQAEAKIARHYEAEPSTNSENKPTRQTSQERKQ